MDRVKSKIPFVKLSETILRTSTASVNATSILNQWRNDFKLLNNFPTNIYMTHKMYFPVFCPQLITGMRITYR